MCGFRQDMRFCPYLRRTKLCITGSTLQSLYLDPAIPRVHTDSPRPVIKTNIETRPRTRSSMDGCSESDIHFSMNRCATMILEKFS